MGKWVEIIDQGARIVARSYSNCPQTGRKFYHPPPHSDGDGNHCHGGGAVNVNGGGAKSSGGGFGGSSFDVILYSV
ncbi:hypothetical protein L195_g056265 [Trifolium pratense]|uniref:Uncharacterized protein n=2 Tax=Trifolium pratense TaxID=57577 RepID=A0A2K3KQQ2_TRIPR|nr:hypothetical protein L195_g056265 [Trifolium pratense]CAJ2639109.1 unnamed protein product [Trifolium pratense]